METKAAISGQFVDVPQRPAAGATQPLHGGSLILPTRRSLDRVVQLAGDLLNAPIALAWLMAHDRRLLMSCCGLSGPIAMLLSHPFCRRVVSSGRPLAISDGRADPATANSAAVRDKMVRAYAGMPLVAADGRIVGTLCVMDPEPRQWTMPQLDILGALADRVLTYRD